MDHLPLPTKSIRETHIKIPYLGLVQYDQIDFFSYLQRNNIQEADITNFHHQVPHTNLRLSYLQEWLFFGSLHEFAKICALPLNLHSFIETDAKKAKHITTAPLQDFASRLIYANVKAYPPENWTSLAPSEPWSTVVSQKPIFMIAGLTERFGMAEELQSQRRRKVGDLLRKIKSLPIWWGSPNQPETTLQPHVVWSIGILLESIHYISHLCYGAQSEISPRLDLGYVVSDMQRRGWCPSRLADKVSCLSPSLTYILGTLESSDDREHDICTDIKCVEPPLAMTKSKIGHDERSCRGFCPMVFVDECEVVTILTQGDYPLIKISIDAIGGFRLTAVSAALSSRYVAISHVWAHGLGNPHNNAIPACQVGKIHRLIDSMGGTETLLWLDTLCVPVSDNHRKYRKLALFKMRESYANASKVLVLDFCLQEVGESIYERRLQISCSEWMQRLWTLQEALIPKAEDLLFQFKDGAVPLSDLVTDSTLVEPSRQKTNEDFMGGWSEIWHNLEIQTSQILRKHFPKSSTDENDLLVLVRTLQRRTTTKIEDEPICLATLTNVPLEQFDGRPTLAQVLKAIDRIPENIVFIPGPRMVNSGFCWAPQSFLQQRPSQLGQSKAATEENNAIGTLTDRGVKIVKPSVTLDQGFRIGEDFANFEAFELRTQDDQIYKIRASTHLDHSSSQLLPRLLNTAAVIFERKELQPGGLVHAVLVSDITEGEDGNYCHYEAGLALSRLTKSANDEIRALSVFYQGPAVWYVG